MRIRDVTEHELVISSFARKQQNEVQQLETSHHVINAMLVSLNVGCLGLFRYAEDPWAHPVLTASEDVTGTNAREYPLIVTPDTAAAYQTPIPLTERNVYDTALIFGIVAREDTPVLYGEYCRGLLLLRMNCHALNFRREAYLCFYRALEHFAAVRILGVKRLQNELKDLQRALRTLTDAGDLIAELGEVYKLRSTQVAHSQQLQRELTIDEVLKVKTFLDFVMHKTFKAEANRMMEARRKAVEGRKGGDPSTGA